MKYPDLGPFLSLCHERQYDIGCKHGEREAMERCRQCMVEVGEELLARPEDVRTKPALVNDAPKAAALVWNDATENARTIVERHRRHVELSPGVGAEVQAYAIGVCDDILNDLRGPQPLTGSDDA